MYRNYIKRALDFILALLGLVILSPVYLILILLVRIKLGSPVFFGQERPGYQEKIFRLHKFRTMTDARDENGKLLPDRERLTKFGRLLRRTSLDELPELVNILKGEMSFIGPRPLLPEYLPYYTQEERLRHTVRPGLTGLAQASGRNLVNWDRRLAYDVEYVKGLSFAMDCRVIVKTVQTVFGHSETVADDTNAAEGNFAEIRRKRMEEQG
ncbi:MAG: sugar transferase [Eubacteriales bacterium]|nr:sugar transferase [Eubacteriales bacterium]